MTPRPTVLLDATSLPPNKGGVARYVAGVLQGLSMTGRSVAVVVKPGDRTWLEQQAPGHEYHESPTWTSWRPARLVWEQVGLPRLARRLAVDVVHSPHYTFALSLRRRTVVTMHDATFFSDPRAHSRGKRWFFASWMRAGRRFAGASVVPSRATAEEIRRFTGAPSRPVTVALHGVDESVFHPPGKDEVRRFAERHGLDLADGWVAFLGTVEPRKNVPALVAAHAALVDAGTSPPPLVVAGGLGWDDRAAAMLTTVASVDEGPLRYLGYLPLDEMSAFLGGATVVVYPSSGEGFGLPVLEAMSSRAAVLTTRRLALPEVGGDAVAYCEPDTEGIGRELGLLLADPGRRERLASAGRERAAGFTWAACAEAHGTAYAAVVTRSS